MTALITLSEMERVMLAANVSVFTLWFSKNIILRVIIGMLSKINLKKLEERLTGTIHLFTNKRLTMTSLKDIK